MEVDLSSDFSTQWQYKMDTAEGNVNCYFMACRNEVLTYVKRRFIAHYRKYAPHRNSINN